MASTLATPTDLAQQVLDVAAAALEPTPGGPITDKFLSASDPALDCCPFLAVVMKRIGEEVTSPLTPGGTAQRSTLGSVNLLTFQIHAVRCSAGAGNVDGIPTPEQKSYTAMVVQQDGWALWNAFRAAIRANEIFNTCTGVHFDGGYSMPEQGGCVGWIMSMRASVDGIVP